jgi:hypothetical protein
LKYLLLSLIMSLGYFVWKGNDENLDVVPDEQFEKLKKDKKFQKEVFKVMELTVPQPQDTIDFKNQDIHQYIIPTDAVQMEILKVFVNNWNSPNHGSRTSMVSDLQSVINTNRFTSFFSMKDLLMKLPAGQYPEEKRAIMTVMGQMELQNDSQEMRRLALEYIDSIKTPDDAKVEDVRIAIELYLKHTESPDEAKAQMQILLDREPNERVQAEIQSLFESKFPSY